MMKISIRNFGTAAARKVQVQLVSAAYPDSDMPAYDVFPAEERRALAAYLLGR